VSAAITILLFNDYVAAQQIVEVFANTIVSDATQRASGFLIGYSGTRPPTSEISPLNPKFVRCRSSTAKTAKPKKLIFAKCLSFGNHWPSEVKEDHLNVAAILCSSINGS
jgi:hypothetical protein